MGGAVNDFWTMVDLSAGPDACWPWKGNRDRDGYGIIGRSRAHRVAYIEGNQRTPGPRAVVRHSCDNPSCCNPKHLSAGMQWMNVRDRNERGRTAKGEQNGRALLGPAEVLAIYQTPLSASVLAAMFGVSKWAVIDIKRGRNWGWLTAAYSHMGTRRREQRGNLRVND